MANFSTFDKSYDEIKKRGQVQSAEPNAPLKMSTPAGGHVNAGVNNVNRDTLNYNRGNAGTAGSTTYTVNAGNQPYVNQLNALYDQIMNRKPFQYDLNGDLLYQQMADQATQLGQKASRDAMGQAAGLTGGYGNSYAQQVGNQAYQQQLTAMNQNIPDLYQQAMNAYLAQGDQMLQQYQLAAAHPGMVESIRPQTITTTQPSAGSGEGLQSWTQFVQNALTMNPSFDLAGYLKQVEEELKT